MQYAERFKSNISSDRAKLDKDKVITAIELLNQKLKSSPVAVIKDVKLSELIEIFNL